MSTVQEKVGIYIQEDMDVTKRSWLIAALGRKNGVISAWFEHENYHLLTVCFKREKFNHITLLDTVKEHGYHGKIMHD